MRTSLPILIFLCLAPTALAETIVLATYNVEHFDSHFEAARLRKWAATQPNAAELKRIVDEEKRQNDEDNWEVAQVITDRWLDPDILMLQECCSQADLKDFNRRWLRGAYETVIVFPGNSERSQYLGMMLKPGFKIVERKDEYHLEPDSVANERSDRLFARGPAFCLVESPGGYRFWVGTTHQKSKADNGPAVTAWRNREARRTHQIVQELRAQGPDDVILLGDMNDEIGLQEFEEDNGGDTIANLLGPPEVGLILATRDLADSGHISFGGYWVPTRRSFVDHVVVTKEMQDQVLSVRVFMPRLARVASDHYPVVVRIRSDLSPATQPAAPAASVAEESLQPATLPVR